MPTGYTRQSAAQITSGATIRAEHFNNEFNLLEDFANATTGHNHDGTLGGGAPIALSSLTISGTSGGVPYYSSTTAISSSGLLTNNAIVLGGGASTAPKVLGSLGTTTTVLHGNAAGAPTFGAVSLTTDVTGVLPIANGGTGSATQVNLLKANNLSDVTDASASRSNLGLVIGTDVQAYDADTSKTDVSETRSAAINMADNVLQRPEIKDYSETTASVNAASTTTIDIVDGNVVLLAHGTNISTFTWSNPSPTGKSCSFTLKRTKDNSGTSRTIAWPAAVKWTLGAAPSLTQTANAVDVFSFFTTDAGTTWYGTYILDLR